MTKEFNRARQALDCLERLLKKGVADPSSREYAASDTAFLREFAFEIDTRLDDLPATYPANAGGVSKS